MKRRINAGRLRRGLVASVAVVTLLTGIIGAQEGFTLMLALLAVGVELITVASILLSELLAARE